ncbi:transglycosylase SLT domain-containing protein [Baekduia soli]|uniref:transglycosylase SLT domain-containing protein n=1 Tax=Baekduia soli TaxID=496014 RepID=UPI001652AC91|nr:transglycosylase SLT domain-containing protein [Baekduia soli]
MAVAAVVVLLLAGRDQQAGPRHLAPGRGRTDTTADPLAYDSRRRAEFEARAAAGLSHVLYDKSPGGVPATARRVASLRPTIDDVARRAHQDPDTLEAIVFLESAGRPDVAASDDLSSAAGLTQILAQTATGLLGLKVDVAASEKLTRSIGRSTSLAHRRRLLAQRRRVDERFDPRKALEATTRYLEFAKGRLGRDDLAVESYHMGVGNLQNALKAYGEDGIPYTQLFFDSTPLRHAAAWRILAGLGDDSSTYLWRIGAAKAIMALYRRDPAALARQARLQAAPSAENVLRPPASTPRFGDDAALRSDALVALDPPVLAAARVRLSRALAAAPAGTRTLRPPALALLRYLGQGVAAIARTSPLVLSAATRSVAGEATSGEGGAGIEASPSLHTTGYAFDVSRAYRTPAQAQAFQFWLDRLTALDLIAWTRGPDSIHVAVGPRAGALVGPMLGATSG